MEANIRPASFHNLFPKLDSYFSFSDIKQAAIVWIQPIELANFIKTTVPKLTHPIILVVNTCDDTFPYCLNSSKLLRQLLESPYIFHLFIQNCAIASHPKVTQIPIGLDLHTLAYGKKAFLESRQSVVHQEAVLNRMREKSKSRQKKIAACGDFHFHDTMRGSNKLNLFFNEDRTSIYNRLKKNPSVVFFENPMPRNELWEKKIDYWFSLCPPGNGIDTHRVWEDLILGLIPIVKTSPLDALYQQFPIVIVKDWGEVNQTNLLYWKSLYQDQVFSDETALKLQQSYWLELIRDRQKACLSTK